MKTLQLLFLLLFPVLLSAQNTTYDSTLAHQYGADDYGMKRYVFVILKTGANQTTDKPFIDSMFKGHLSNIGRLADSGLLVVAGPLQKNDKTYRGIFILNVKTETEALQILETDPAISSGLLEPEIYLWYGSAALPAYLPVHGKIQKVSVSD